MSMENPYSMSGETVLITGGGTGIGLGIGRCMLAAGAEKVILVGRRETVLAEAASELGTKASYLSQDIAKIEEIPNFAQTTSSSENKTLSSTSGLEEKLSKKNFEALFWALSTLHPHYS